MTAQVIAMQHEPADRAAVQALHIVADGLTAHGFDTRSPTWEQSQRLDISNVRGALCALSLTGSGEATWEYRPCHGTCTDPAHITAIVLRILAGDAASGGAPPAPSGGLTLKGAVGRALAERGMTVCLTVIHQDDTNYDLYAEIDVASPADPGRGHVRVADDGTIRWHCTYHDPADDTVGLRPGDIAETIANALAGQNT
jgi:hypothetical protein